VELKISKSSFQHIWKAGFGQTFWFDNRKLSWS